MIKSTISLKASKPHLKADQTGRQFTYMDMRALAVMFADVVSHRGDKISPLEFDAFYNNVIVPRLKSSEQMRNKMELVEEGI